MTHGISQKKAAELLKQYGFNELPSAKPKNVWQIALEVIQEPMFILLMFCGLVYVLLGDYYVTKNFQQFHALDLEYVVDEEIIKSN